MRLVATPPALLWLEEVAEDRQRSPSKADAKPDEELGWKAGNRRGEPWRRSERAVGLLKELEHPVEARRKAAQEDQGAGDHEEARKRACSCHGVELEVQVGPTGIEIGVAIADIDVVGPREVYELLDLCIGQVVPDGRYTPIAEAPAKRDWRRLGVAVQRRQDLAPFRLLGEGLA